MERIIGLSKLQAAIDEAYKLFKSESCGTVDSRLADTDVNDLGIAAVLTDGTQLASGDSGKPFAIGAIAKVPLFELLLSQYSIDDLLKMSGRCECKKHDKPAIAVSPHGIRATSAVQPVGDPDAKWDLIINNIIDLMGTTPELDDNLYKKLKDEVETAGTIETIANAEYPLYDDTALAIDLYLRQLSLKASASQLASMGATIAADGVNPLTGKIVYDGKLSQSIVASMAARGPHKANKGWLVATGLPAVSGFGGGIIGVFPGQMGIAAYSPGLTEKGFSAKAAEALRFVMNKLDISVFGSAHIHFDKNK